MTARVGALGLALMLAACGGNEDKDEIAGTPQSVTMSDLQVLNGEEVRRVLTGNTLVGYDQAGPYWMYYPSGGTIWGQASNGDVDIGRWRVDGDLYCRSWRRWGDQSEQCWQFATDGLNRLIWIDPNGRKFGESTVQSGNTIGQITGREPPSFPPLLRQPHPVGVGHRCADTAINHCQIEPFDRGTRVALLGRPATP